MIGPLGLPEHSSKEARQRVLVRRCYLNPQANRRFRPSFNLAGFEVVDCQDDFVRNALGFDDEPEAKPAPPPETPQAEGTDASSWGGCGGFRSFLESRGFAPLGICWERGADRSLKLRAAESERPRRFPSGVFFRAWEPSGLQAVN